MDYTPEQTRTRRLQHEERKNRPFLMGCHDLDRLSCRTYRGPKSCELLSTYHLGVPMIYWRVKYEFAYGFTMP
jgi:hypothetical protein